MATSEHSPSSSSDSLLATCIWGVVLAIPILLLFAPVFEGQVLDGMIDRKEVTNPFHYLNLRAFQAGQFPQWDPYQFNGVPISQTGIDLALSPLNWPLYFFGTEARVLTYLTWLQIVKHLFMGIFAMMFFRRVLPSMEGAVFAALAYSWSSAAVWSTITSELTTFVFLPLGMYVLHASTRRIRAWHIAVFAAILAIDVVGDYYQWTFYMWLCWSSYALYLSIGAARWSARLRFLPPRFRDRSIRIPTPLAVVAYGSLLAGFLSMPKVFPFFMALAHGDALRNTGMASALDSFRTPVSALARLLSGNILGFVTHPDFPLLFAYGPHQNYVETMLGYAGALTLGFAVMALASSTIRRTIRFPGTMSILIIVLVLGTPVTMVFLFLTGSQLIYSRLAVYLSFFIAWLAGAGLANIAALLHDLRAKRVLVVLLFISGVMLGWLCLELLLYRAGYSNLIFQLFDPQHAVRGADFDRYYLDVFLTSFAILSSVVVSALLLIELLRRNILGVRTFQISIILVTGTELYLSALLYETRTYFSFLVPEPDLYSTNADLEKIKDEYRRSQNFRIADFRYATPFRNPFPVSNSNTIYGVPQVSGFTNTVPARLTTLSAALDGTVVAFRTVHVHDRLAQVSAAAYRQTVGPTFSFPQIEDAQPRARLLANFTRSDSSADTLKHIRAGHDLVASPIIVADGSLPLQARAGSPGDAPAGTVIWHDSGPNEKSLTVDAREDTLLYIADSLQPGWRATVDGKTSQIYEANYAFLAIFIPRGEHKVRFYYRNPYLSVGVAFAVFGILLGMVHILIARFRRSKTSQEPSGLAG